jgi:hypothetical protein
LPEKHSSRQQENECQESSGASSGSGTDFLAFTVYVQPQICKDECLQGAAKFFATATDIGV